MRTVDNNRWIYLADGTRRRRTLNDPVIGPAIPDHQEVAGEDVSVEEVSHAAAATAGAVTLAAELGVDLSTIEGTGKDGKITAGDVRAAAE